MKKDPEPKKPKLQLNPKVLLAKIKPIAKHHYFIVFMLLFGGLIYGVYIMNETLNLPTDTEYATTKNQTTIGNKFNKQTQETITKIEELQKSTDPNEGETPFPAGRINPFAE